jgi:hypothetical protein
MQTRSAQGRRQSNEARGLQRGCQHPHVQVPHGGHASREPSQSLNQSLNTNPAFGLELFF